MDNQTPVTPVSTPLVAVKQPKQSNFLVILLSVLLTVSVAISGFFAFQTQKLFKELTILKNEPESVFPMYTEPVATDSSEVDSTADWKTYTNKVFKFNFKYPNEYQLTDNLQESTDPLAWTTKKYIQLDNPTNKCSMLIMINPDGFGPWFPNKMLSLSYGDSKGFYVLNETINTENLTDNIYNLVLNGANSKAPYGFLAFANCPDTQTNRIYLDNLIIQILTTFKFTN